MAAFLAGTEPTDTCDHAAAAGQQQGFFSRILGLGPKPSPPPPVSNAGQQQPVGTVLQEPPSAPQAPPPEKKKGFFGKIAGVFKGDDSNKNSGNSGNDPNQPRR
jgi:penicillin-binding protein 1B